MLLLNVVPLVAAYRWMSRLHGGDRLARYADTSLLHYAVQYLAVGIAGLLGVLSIGSLLLIVTLLSVGLLLLAGRTSRPVNAEQPVGWPLRLAALWTLAFLVALLEHGWISPPLANDPLIYHLPAAVQWLQTGKLGWFETWFHNPANTYSPLAGSMFLAWWMAPLGNDFVARYGQMPALALLLLTSARLARDLGVRPAPAAMLALAAVLCRPVIGQTQLAKDDLFVAAFFVSALSSLANPALRDRFGMIRLGMSVGLLLATKYTVAYALPMLLLAIDAPRRAGWNARQHLLTLAIVIVIAGPWFLRNLLAGGNPLFPARVELLGATLLPGPLRMTAEPSLGTWNGFHDTVIASYYGTTLPLAIVLGLGWLAAMAFQRRQVVRDPMARGMLIGPLLSMLAFAWTSPYAEARFVLPAILALLLFPAWMVRPDPATAPGDNPVRAGSTANAGRPSRHHLVLVASSITLLAAGATSFIPETLGHLAPTTLVAFAALTAIATVVRVGWSNPRTRQALIGAGTFLSAAAVYVFWDAYLVGYRVKIERDAAWTLPGYYGDEGRAWLWARRELPEETTIAVVNTPFAYPLQGFGLTRRVVGVSSSAIIPSLASLPRIEQPLRGQDIIPQVVRLLRRDADRAAWLARLDAAGVEYVFIGLDLMRGEGPPPELAFCESSPAEFRRVFANGSAIVYRRERR